MVQTKRSFDYVKINLMSEMTENFENPRLKISQTILNNGE